jgi:hypothetical protein
LYKQEYLSIDKVECVDEESLTTSEASGPTQMNLGSTILMQFKSISRTEKIDSIDQWEEGGSLSMQQVKRMSQCREALRKKD